MEDKETKNGNDPVMDIKSASAYLKISDAKLRRMVSDQRIPYFRLDGRILFYRSVLELWILSLIVQPVEQKADVATTIWSKALGGK